MDEEKKTLRQILKECGRYEFKENTIYLYDNAFLCDRKLIDVLRAHDIKIQLDLFT